VCSSDLYNHYISALNKCHPEYVSFLLDKKSLSVKDVNSILQMIPDEMKLFFKKDYAQEIYIRFQSKYFDDSRNYLTLRKLLEDKKVLLLGPGESLNLEKSVINTYIKEYNPVVISTNFIPTDFKIDYAFFSNIKRYSKLKELDEIIDLREKLIITSNIIENDIKIDFQFSYESLIEKDNIIIDNSLLLLINALIKLDIKDINLAGFDGYNEKNMNYYKRDFSFDFTRDQILNNNATIAKYLNKNKKNLTLNFVTKSLYEIE
jgi:4-hydroxy 2-oxovalerate aldolase